MIAALAEQREKRYLITLESQAFRLRLAGDDRTDQTLLTAVAGHGLRGWLADRFVWPAYQYQGLRSVPDSLQALFEPPEDDGTIAEAPPND